MNLIDIQNLRTYFFMERGQVKAVDDVSFNIKKGEAVGLAGESGCGKTTTAYSIMRLIPDPGRIVDGHIYFDGRELVQLDEEEMRKIRWKKISIIFQGAMNALNPVISIGDQICEAITLHEDVSKEEALERAEKLFGKVGLGPERINNYPFEFSGGMRQRAMISMALACNPDLIIADEPTTALDVSIQAQILDLIASLGKTLNTSLLLITHDLSVIAETCNRAAIMYAGRIVEDADVVSLFQHPVHPYTKGLIEAIPSMERGKSRMLFSIPGEPPDLINPPPGCRFHPRCPYAKGICSTEKPRPQEVIGRMVECHFADEVKDLTSGELWGE